jgi:hypothetical protein
VQQEESEFQLPSASTSSGIDWSDVIDAIGKLTPQSKPLRIDEVLPSDVPEKNKMRALAGARRSLLKALSKLQVRDGKTAADFVDVGYAKGEALVVRLKKA